jgi:hypothetical protein
MKTFSTKVFTPTTPAELTFVERDEINEQLVDAINQPGKQIVVYGYSGSGKTTLLRNKLNQIYENYIISRCSESISIEQLILNAFDNLDKYYRSEFTSKTGWKIGSDIGAEYSFIKAKLTGEFSSEKLSKSQRIVPPQLTIQRLAEFLGAAKCCWIIEDFHKVKEEEKTNLSQSVKIFMDTAFDFPEVKIIAIGAVGTAREVVAYDREMQTRVAEIHVPLMNKSQLTEIINKGENLLNIKIDEDIRDKIVDLSNGLASVCHQLCLNMCVINNIKVTENSTFRFTDRDLENAIKKYLNEQSDTFKSTFENAIKVERKGGKFENGELILAAVSNMHNDHVSRRDILSEIRKVEPSYPGGNLTAYLKQLISTEKDEILRFDEKSGKYSFSNPFLKVYSRMLFEKKSKSEHHKVIVQIGNSNISVEGDIGNVNVNVKGTGMSRNEINWESLPNELIILLKKIKNTSPNANTTFNTLSSAITKFSIRRNDEGIEILSNIEDWVWNEAINLGLSQVVKAFKIAKKSK